MMLVSILRFIGSFWFSLTVFTIYITNSSNNYLFAAAQLCDFGPNPLTEAAGQPVPQTCIDVPFDKGSGVVEMQSRCYYTYVPQSESCSSNFSPEEAVPVVFDIHGYTSCPLFSYGYTGWKEQADKDCFVVVWPSGNNGMPGSMGTCWSLPGGLRSDDYGMPGGNNVTTPPCCCMNVFSAESSLKEPKPDDPLFLRMAIDKVVEDFSRGAWEEEFMQRVRIDRSRVYMAGHSNGCFTSLSMAALHNDVVAAVCCHSGGVLTPFEMDKYGSSPVPIWMLHGVLDEVVPFDGSSSMPPFRDMGLWSLPNALEYLSQVNGCKEAGAKDLVMNADSNTVVHFSNDDNNDMEKVVGTVFERTNCTQGATVKLVALLESGHSPYATYPEALLMGETKTTIDTTAMAWEFCSAHSKSPQQPDPDGEVTEETDEELEPIEAGEEEAATETPEEGTAKEEGANKSESSSGSDPRLSFGRRGFGIDALLVLLFLSSVASLIR